MYHDCHSVFVGSPKYTAQLGNLAGIIHVHIGVAEMQFKAASKIRVLRASRNLGHRVSLKRINTTKGAKPVRIIGYLVRGPVVFSPYLSILVRNRRFVWIAVLKR